MESLLENKLLLYSLASSTAVIFALALGIIPDIALQFEIVDFPSDVSSPNYKKKLLLLYLYKKKKMFFFYSFEQS